MKTLKKIRTAIILFSAILLTLGLWQYSKRFGRFQDPRLDFIFQARDLSNNLVKPIKTEFLILNFWASWCPPCVEETPSLIRFVEKNKQHFTLLAMSQDSTKDEVLSFMKTFPSLKSEAITIVHDDNQSVARSFFIKKLPETFIYSVKKNKYMQFSGSTDWENPLLLEAIKKNFDSSFN